MENCLHATPDANSIPGVVRYTKEGVQNYFATIGKLTLFVQELRFPNKSRRKLGFL